MKNIRAKALAILLFLMVTVPVAAEGRSWSEWFNNSFYEPVSDRLTSVHGRLEANSWNEAKNIGVSAALICGSVWTMHTVGELLRQHKKAVQKERQIAQREVLAQYPHLNNHNINPLLMQQLMQQELLPPIGMMPTDHKDLPDEGDQVIDEQKSVSLDVAEFSKEELEDYYNRLFVLEHKLTSSWLRTYQVIWYSAFITLIGGVSQFLDQSGRVWSGKSSDELDILEEQIKKVHEIRQEAQGSDSANFKDTCFWTEVSRLTGVPHLKLRNCIEDIFKTIKEDRENKKKFNTTDSIAKILQWARLEFLSNPYARVRLRGVSILPEELNNIIQSEYASRIYRGEDIKISTEEE